MQNGVLAQGSDNYKKKKKKRTMRDWLAEPTQMRQPMVTLVMKSQQNNLNMHLHFTMRHSSGNAD